MYFCLRGPEKEIVHGSPFSLSGILVCNTFRKQLEKEI